MNVAARQVERGALPAGPAGAARRRARVPAPLAAIMAVAAILGVCWSALTPAFQAPDEQSHFAYAQYLAERFKLPGDLRLSIYSDEHGDASRAVNADQVAAQPMVKPEWSDRVYRRWQAQDRRNRRDNGGGAVSSAAYPPLSYLWEAGAYRLASGGDFFDRLLAARLASVLWLPVTVLATWLLAGEVFGRRRLLQLTAASVPALLPMVAFISGSVSPDGMLYGLWSLALWLGTRIIRRGLTPATVVGLSLSAGAACVVKATAFALLPAAGLALAVGVWRARGRARRVALPAVLGAIPGAAVIAAWFALAHALHRPAAAQVSGATAAAPGTDWPQMLSYLWQYYLPRLPGLTPFPFPGGAHPAFHTWIEQGWGAFGWLEVRFPLNLYRVLALATAAVGALALGALWRARRAVDWAVAAFLGLAAGGLLAGLHWTDYHFARVGAGFMQGRYGFPIIALAGLALAGAVSLLSPRRRPLAAGAAIAGLFVFHIVSLGLVLERFYA